MIPLLMVAGEASGDLHGARLLAELRREEPELSAFGLGGDEMVAAGLAAVAHSGEISVVGITEALSVLPRARRIFHRLLAEVDRRRPAAAVLIDSPEFNLRLARALKRRGLKVIYYISPQVWAWRRGRVRTIARRVDRMLVLFPFEEDFYRRRGVAVTMVGHPLVDEVPSLPQAWDTAPPDGGPYQVALLPGSRPSEVEALLPAMLAAVAEVSRRLPVAARIVRAPTVPAARVEAAVAASGLPVEVVTGKRFEHLAACHLAFCASGTATLEVGLLGTPMIVLYRLRPWTYLLARLLVRLPRISLVNLVLGESAVPELLQGEVNPRRVAAEAVALLTDPARVAKMRAALGRLRPRLGEGGATRRAAAAVLEELGVGVAA
jgi:lipid-A-disaccharide synthase